MKNWNGKPYYSFDYMLKERFSEKIYKTALNGGMTCPNRDGTLEPGDVSSAVREDRETSPETGETLSHFRLINRQKNFSKNAMPLLLLHTFRPIPILMLL